MSDQSSVVLCTEELLQTFDSLLDVVNLTLIH